MHTLKPFHVNMDIWVPIYLCEIGFYMKASESEWSNQRQKDSIDEKYYNIHGNIR